MSEHIGARQFHEADGTQDWRVISEGACSFFRTGSFAAGARVAAALAAGGRLVRDDFAPSWWTLADAAGNEADIATIAHRD